MIYDEGLTSVGGWNATNAWSSIKEVKKKVSKGIGYLANEIVAIKSDGSTCVDLFKTMRFTVVALRTLRGEGIETSDIVQNLETSINLLEGLQFIEVLNDIFYEDQKSEVGGNEDEIKEEVTLHQKITTGAFMISDCIGGSLWLLEIGIPLFGPFSESLGLICFLTHLSSGTAFVGFLAEGGGAVVELWNLWEKDDPKKYHALLTTAHRTAGVISIILSVTGAVSVPVVIGFGIAASSFGIVRFVYKRHFIN